MKQHQWKEEPVRWSWDCSLSYSEIECEHWMWSRISICPRLELVGMKMPREGMKEIPEWQEKMTEAIHFSHRLQDNGYPSQKGLPTHQWMVTAGTYPDRTGDVITVPSENWQSSIRSSSFLPLKSCVSCSTISPQITLGNEENWIFWKRLRTWEQIFILSWRKLCSVLSSLGFELSSKIKSI